MENIEPQHKHWQVYTMSHYVPTLKLLKIFLIKPQYAEFWEFRDLLVLLPELPVHFQWNGIKLTFPEIDDSPPWRHMKSEFVIGPVETYKKWSKHHLAYNNVHACSKSVKQRPSSIWSLLPGSMHDWNFVNHFLDTKYLNSLDCMTQGNTKVKSSSLHTKERTKQMLSDCQVTPAWQWNVFNM